MIKIHTKVLKEFDRMEESGVGGEKATAPRKTEKLFWKGILKCVLKIE